MNNHPGIYTNNQWKEGKGSLFQSQNPASQEIVWEGISASPADVDEVFKNARNALFQWASLPIEERSKFLNRFAEILNQELPSIAEAISKETGKPLWDSKNEVNSMISKVSISLEAYGHRCAGIIREYDGIRSITRHHPHGVVGVLGPFNFPGHLPNGHIIPALLAGNTVVFKPSELTPLVAEKMIQCWEKTGIPPGVINLIQGAAETGQALTHHPMLNGLYFTGSYKVGNTLATYFGEHPEKILALEMGGNNPLIIGDLNESKIGAYLTIQSAYLSAGQRCTCARRLIIVKGKRGEDFLHELVKMIDRITIGSYQSTPEPYMGPVVRESHALKILTAQENLKNLGGKPIVEMLHMQPGTGFLTPGLMDVTAIQNKPDEEIFGPFLQVIWKNSLEEALEEANATRFGLTAGLLSADQKEFVKFCQNIKAGLISWNVPLTGASSAAPFGGVKCSGNFRPSAYYAADYCSYPVVCSEAPIIHPPKVLPPGLKIEFNGLT